MVRRYASCKRGYGGSHPPSPGSLHRRRERWGDAYGSLLPVGDVDGMSCHDTWQTDTCENAQESGGAQILGMRSSRLASPEKAS